VSGGREECTLITSLPLPLLLVPLVILVHTSSHHFSFPHFLLASSLSHLLFHFTSSLASSDPCTKTGYIEVGICLGSALVFGVILVILAYRSNPLQKFLLGFVCVLSVLVTKRKTEFTHSIFRSLIPSNLVNLEVTVPHDQRNHPDCRAPNTK
jgi:hypothetical protein